MRHARSETFILPGGAAPHLSTNLSDGSDRTVESRSRRRRDRAVGPDPDMGGGAAAANVTLPRPQRRIDSETLLGGERTLVIRHQGEEYTLRLTRLGKLLLTK